MLCWLQTCNLTKWQKTLEHHLQGTQVKSVTEGFCIQPSCDLGRRHGRIFSNMQRPILNKRRKKT